MNDFTNYRNDGFKGFKTVNELNNDSYGLIPKEKGIYLVLRSTESAPVFVTQGTGGHFKGRDPNVSLEELKSKWIEGENLLYIGKAGGSGAASTLQSRIKQLVKFGQGQNIGHWGGRYLWQLQDAQELVICWKVSADAEPKAEEAEQLQQFKNGHQGRLPFANLQSPGTKERLSLFNAPTVSSI